MTTLEIFLVLALTVVSTVLFIVSYVSLQAANTIGDILFRRKSSKKKEKK